jgi:phosphoribosylaminoimidazolecarboxamide formyltransferase/IMP cyclohydrolase
MSAGRGGGHEERIVPVRRAILSVYDKEGIVDLARVLVERGVEILSTGGTARLLLEEKVPIRRIAELTGVPEMLDGRVKTLHPLVHAGILAVRDNPRHVEDLERTEAPLIDLVVVNLYPFEQTAQMEDIGLAEIVEMIDIGGPTMVRAAAKNFRDVGVVVDPRDYELVAEDLQGRGGLTDETRMRLAQRAFHHTACYDTAIYSYLSQLKAGGARPSTEPLFPQKMVLGLEKVRDLRYGENPHQRAAFYAEPHGNEASLAAAVQISGRELSYNNLLDLDAAIAIASSIEGCGCAVIKHNNPCGAAVGENAAEAFERARQGDPVSAFGGIVAFNDTVDLDAAERMAEMFLEAVIAPEYSADALERLQRKKKLRVLQWAGRPGTARGGLDLRRVAGGFLVQEWDPEAGTDEMRVVSRRPPTAEEWEALRFAWRVCRHVRSNAIVFAQPGMVVGVGAGQMSRVDSVRLAAGKAGERAQGAAMASDAFFPFRDGIDEAVQAGVRAVVQPGGSIRDEEVIAAADEQDVAMVLTGRRHFRH